MKMEFFKVILNMNNPSDNNADLYLLVVVYGIQISIQQQAYRGNRCPSLLTLLKSGHFENQKSKRASIKMTETRRRILIIVIINVMFLKVLG